MNPLEAALREICAHLDALKKSWALIGGLAVSARAQPRFTRDIDVAVAVADDAEAERLVYELQLRRYQAFFSAEQDATHRLATVRLAPPGGFGVVVDVLFASSGIEPELVGRAERIELFPQLHLPVARIGDLLALKVLAVDAKRPHDRGDLQALFAEASDADMVQATESLRLIQERGFHRGKDLLADFEKLRLELG